MVCSKWTLRPGHSRSPRVCRPSFLFSVVILLLTGDIETNPGPGPKHPCATSSKAVKSNQRVRCATNGTMPNALVCVSQSTNDRLSVMKAGAVIALTRRPSPFMTPLEYLQNLSHPFSPAAPSPLIPRRSLLLALALSIIPIVGVFFPKWIT